MIDELTVAYTGDDKFDPITVSGKVSNNNLY